MKSMITGLGNHPKLKMRQKEKNIVRKGCRYCKSPKTQNETKEKIL